MERVYILFRTRLFSISRAELDSSFETKHSISGARTAATRDRRFAPPRGEAVATAAAAAAAAAAGGWRPLLPLQ